MSVELHNVTKTFRKRGQFIKALDDINLTISKGEFLSFLGPNGAGKTTLTKLLSTLLLPDSGEVFIEGIPISNDSAIRPLISTVFGESGGRSLYYRLSLLDNLLFFSSLAGISRKEAKIRIDSLLEYFDLSDKRNVQVMKLSTGMKAKVLLIRALLTSPRILLLDEPTLGLDALSSDKVKVLLRLFNQKFKTTIILTSHNFSDIDDLSHRLLLMDQGQILQDTTPSLFKTSTTEAFIDLSFSLPLFHPESFTKQILSPVGAELILFNLSDKTNSESNSVINARIQPKRLSTDETISRLVSLMTTIGANIFRISPYAPTLKESFVSFLRNKEKVALEVVNQLS